MRATTSLALLCMTVFAATGCASLSIEARGGSSTVPEPPPKAGPGHSTPSRLGIPPGHFPPAGQCRVWHPGRPPGHQPAPGSCSVVEQDVGPGDWLVYRPTSEKKVVRVSFYDSRSPRVRIAVRVYDYRTGEFLREM
ncbi:MAG TPA: hypothetical protein VD788_09045 [Candidatus Polarisedimenticolaceae bacterium]|nr:hypothetical protein [Candidatus Polarisedimenticolaceae bacterium]